jgi:putative phage-type endonuclease
MVKSMSEDNESMRRTITAIADRASWLEGRKRNVNASDMAALFHAHPHKTALQLWGEQTGRLSSDWQPDNDALRRGRILEPAVAAAMRETHPDWRIWTPGQYAELPERRIGATPDFLADDNGGSPLLIQAKTVLADIYAQEWTPAPPAHYLIQVQTEMLVTGIDRCILAVLVLDGRRFPVHEYAFYADEEFQQEILVATARFWCCVDSGEEPHLKHPQDGGTLGRLYPDGAPEPVLALHGEADFVGLCEAHHGLGKRIKALEEQRSARGSAIMARLRNHARADALDWRVNWTTERELSVPAHIKKAHRRLTVSRRPASVGQHHDWP